MTIPLTVPFPATVFDVEFPTVVEFPLSVVVVALVLVVSVVFVVVDVLLAGSAGVVGVVAAVSKNLSREAGAVEVELVVVVRDWQVSPANWTTKVAQRIVSKK